MIVTDQTKRSVQIHDIRNRIISLVPSITETLFALGLGKRVVGITDYCKYPIKKIANCERVGGPQSLNLEKIEKLNPDLIIATKEENVKDDILLLSKKFPLLIGSIITFEDAISFIKKLGIILHKESVADSLIDKINSNYLSDKFCKKSFSYLYLVWHKPIMLAQKGTYINNVLKKLGGNNACPDYLKDIYPEVSIDQIQNINPDIVFLPSEPYEFTNSDLEFYKNVFLNSNVHLVDGEVFCWYGYRMQYLPQYLQNLL